MDNDLVERLRKRADSLEDGMFERATLPPEIELLREAADALSRAPQPDTVTEGMARKLLNVMSNTPDDWAHTTRSIELAKIALTAALAVRVRQNAE